MWSDRSAIRGDRVAQASVLLVLEPIFEADLPDSAYGFRPGRNAHQALDQVRQLLLRGHTEVVDADLASYFDTIPHGNLLRLAARRVGDRGVLGLIGQWLRAPVIEEKTDTRAATPRAGRPRRAGAATRERRRAE